MREPLLGPNAKPFIVQFIVGMIVLFTIAPIFGKFAADTGCRFIGLCSPEAAERIHGLERPL